MHKLIFSDDFKIAMVEFKIDSNAINNESIFNNKDFSLKVHEKDANIKIEELDLIPEAFLDFIYLFEF